MSEERVATYSEEAELGALGAMLLDPVSLIPMARARLGITPEMFYVPANQMACQAMFDLADRDGSERVDALTLIEWLRTQGKLDAIGGGAAVDKMVDGCVTVANADYYLEIVRQKHLLRAVSQLARTVFNECHQADNGEQILAALPDRFMALAGETTEEIDKGEIMTAAVARWREASAARKEGRVVKTGGIATPWKTMTDLTCGLEPGVFVLAGRPSAGKTTLEDILACHAAGAGIPVGRVTLDASARELLERALCRGANCSLPRLKFGFGFDRHFEAMESEQKKLAGLPMYFLENTYEIAQIMSWARLMKARRKIGMLTLDYIQLAHARELGHRDSDPVVRVTHVSGMLKRLALELKIPILVLAQLNREVEKEDRDPRLSDLRDSGAIEQDAHKCGFLYRDMKKLKQMEEKCRGASKHKRPVWFNLLKQKDGETGGIPFWLYPPYFRLEPAEIGLDGTPFTDDAMPTTTRDDQQEFVERPAYMPAEEGERKEKPEDRRQEAGGHAPERSAVHGEPPEWFAGMATEPEEFRSEGEEG